MILTYILSLLNLIDNQYVYIYIVLIIEALCPTLVISIDLKKKKKIGWIITAIIGVIAILIGFGLGYLRELNGNSWYFQIIGMYVIYGLMFLIIILSCDAPINSKILYWIEAMTIREIVDCIFSFLLIAIYQQDHSTTMDIIPSAPSWLNAILWDVIHFGLQIGVFFIFRRKNQVSKDKETTKQTIIITLLTIIFITILKVFLVRYSSESLAMYIICEIFCIFICVILLLSRNNILENNAYRSEIQAMDRIIVEEEKQYESISENIEIINTKAHDIKHQLEFYQNKLASEDIKKLQDAVTIYDLNIKTGNKVLDTVFYERNLKCKKLNISITCIADGKLLDFISQAHLYYLFSNILDNAIEAVSKIDDEDYKIIGVSIYQKGDSVIIEEYNYFYGELNIEKDTIKTSKEDKISHGYGIKSIKYVSNFYNGKLSLKKKNNMFYLKIEFPLV